MTESHLSSNVRSFEDLECWKECRKLRVFVAKKIVPLLPDVEKYRLADQLIRAARSTTANLAEGYGRYHYADNSKFCSNARGSAYEVLDHLITALDEELISEATFERGKKQVHSCVKLINGYRRYLKQASQKK